MHRTRMIIYIGYMFIRKQQNDSSNAENKVLQCQQRFNIKINVKMWINMYQSGDKISKVLLISFIFKFVFLGSATAMYIFGRAERAGFYL